MSRLTVNKDITSLFRNDYGILYTFIIFSLEATIFSYDLKSLFSL